MDKNIQLVADVVSQLAERGIRKVSKDRVVRIRVGY